MTAFLQRLLLGCALLPVALAALGADRAVCVQERRQLEALQQEVVALGQQQAALTNIVAGDLPPASTLAGLLGADPLDEAAVQQALLAAAPAPPATTTATCRSLQADFQQALDDRRWLQQDIRRHQRRWLSLPARPRQALVALWQSYRQLEAQRSTLPPVAADAVADVQLRQVRAMELLPSLGDGRHVQAAALLLLWQEAMTRPLPPRFGAGDGAAHGDPALALRAALLTRHQLDELRRWLWQAQPDSFAAARQAAGLSRPALLAGEWQAATLQLRWLAEDLRHDLQSRLASPRPVVALLSLTATLLFGLAVFLLLLRLARRSVAPLLAASERLARGGRQRWRVRLAGALGSMAPLLPWLLLWLGLDALRAVATGAGWPVLLLLLPLARLYVVLGLARLGGEWLLLRLAQQAGHYLGAEQTRALLPVLRRFALLVALPWLVLTLLEGTVGASLLLSLALPAAGLAWYLGLGGLLYRRHADFVAALQTLLPPALDPLVTRLLDGRRFLLLAPLLLPFLLLALALRFLHELLLEFDWYRKLAARWFKLRSQTGEEEAAATGAVPADYAHWFEAAPADAELPYIDSGLLGAVRKPLQRWLDERTAENLLVLTGEPGIGKSTTLARLCGLLAEEQPALLLRQARVPARSCRPEEVRALVGGLLELTLTPGNRALVDSDAARPPTLVVLDDVHHLFLSQVGGLDGWRTLLSLIGTRLDNVFWLLALDNQAWAYLDNVFGHDYPVLQVLRAKPWSQAELRSLLLSRHHLSGLSLHYDATLLSSRGPDAGNVRNAEQRYFSLLWDASRGNPRLALALWLSSLRVAGDRVSVGLPVEPSRALLAERLGGQALFVHAALVLHGSLDDAELAAVTRLPEPAVQYALKTALDAGLLNRDASGRHRPAPLWQHPLIAHLARKNLLHE